MEPIKRPVEQEFDFVPEITELILQQIDSPDFAKLLDEYHPYDIAQALCHVEKDIRIRVFHKINIKNVADIFEHFDNNDQIEFIREVEPLLAVAIIDHMEADEAVDLLQYLESVDEDIDFVNRLSPKKRAEVKRMWSYEDQQIGSTMSNSFIEIATSMTVRDAMRLVTSVAGETDYISILFVVEKQKLVGYLKLKDLIIARATEIIRDVMESRVISAKATDDKEEVAKFFQDYGLSAIPIVDTDDHLMGIVTHDDLMDIITESKAEDYAKFAALTTGEFDLEDETVKKSVKSRLPWLAILLILSMLTSVFLSIFEGPLSGSDGAKMLAANLAIYLPLLLDMSGNTGTQSLAVMIRYLSTNKKMSRKQVRTYLLREMGTGLLQGVLIGLALFVVMIAIDYFSTGLFMAHVPLITAIVTSSAICIGLFLSNLLGAFLPLFMSWIKVDPAVASGPFITTIADIVTLTMYYAVSLAILLPLYLN